jgi:hypothetical protein
MSEDLIVLAFEGSIQRLPALGQLILGFAYAPDVVIHEWDSRRVTADMYLQPRLIAPVLSRLEQDLHMRQMRTLEIQGLRYGMAWYIVRGSIDKCVRDFKQVFSRRRVRVFEVS